MKTENQKIDHEPTGEVTPEEIEYATQDGRCTVDALNALKQEFDKHPIALKPHNAYSPASVAKSYLEAMGITRPAVKFKISNEEQGISMQSYYGGRSETRIPSGPPDTSACGAGQVYPQSLDRSLVFRSRIPAFPPKCPSCDDF